MKKFLVPIISFLSTQSFSGIILPDLSRSKSQLNLSPIAVSFSERNTINASLDHKNQNATLHGITDLEENTNTVATSVFYSTPRLHVELGLNAAKDKTADPSSVSAANNSDTYNFQGTVAAPFTDNFRAGFSAQLSKYTTTYASSKDEKKDVNFSTGIGFKFQPNLAIGLGISREISSFKTIDSAPTRTTEFPDMTIKTLFTGIAYGVDQKIGENGFGIEAVISHSPKEQVAVNGRVMNRGEVTTLLFDGNYIFNILDLNFLAILSKGKNYDETNASNAQSLIIKSEVMISAPIYVTPQISYYRSKDTNYSGIDTSYTAKMWGYGAGAGWRNTAFDASLNYLHQTAKTTPDDFKLNSNEVSGRFSFYF